MTTPSMPVVPAPPAPETVARRRRERVQLLRGKATRSAAETKELLDMLVDFVLDDASRRPQGRP